MAVFLAAGSGGYIFGTKYFMQMDTAADPADESLEQGKYAADEEGYLEGQDRDLLRTGLRELDQRAELIWDNIAQLQKEIDSYETMLSELKLSEEGKRLITDKWAVRYFVDQWGEPLPSHKVARHCRVKLNDLMFTVRRALSKTKPAIRKGAYPLSPETKRKVAQIEFEVNDAKKQYASHRDLISALAAKLPEGEIASPQTLEDAIEVMRNQMTLEHWRYPAATPPGGNATPSRVRSTDQRLTEPASASDPNDPASLLNDVRRSRSSVGREYVDTTLGRDAVRDRDEPPRPRP
jgi:hypothetical protein